MTQNVQCHHKAIRLWMPSELFQFSLAEKLSFSFFLVQKQNPKVKVEAIRYLQVISCLEMIHEVLIFFLIHLLDQCACGRLQGSDNLLSETRKKRDEQFPWQVFVATHETHHSTSHGQCYLSSFCIFLGPAAELRRNGLLRRSAAEK